MDPITYYVLRYYETSVAYFFRQKLQKSKRISTINWANFRYSPAQILYAANDAQVPLLVYRAWLKWGGSVAALES